MDGMSSVIVEREMDLCIKCVNSVLLLKNGKSLFSSGFIIFVLIQRRHRISCTLQAGFSGTVYRERSAAIHVVKK